MNTSSTDPTIQACLIGDVLGSALPPESGGMSINWEVLSPKDANTVATSGYELLVTTDPLVAHQIHIRSSSMVSGPKKAVVFIKTLDSKPLEHRLSQAIQSHFPTGSLGHVSAQTAAIADHLFFGASAMHFFDRFLLPTSASTSEIRRRFRRLSQRLHPDRFVERTERDLHLVARMDAVYTIVGDTYRLLSNPVSAAIHRYWLQRDALDKAIGLHKCGRIRKLLSMVSAPADQSRVMEILMLQQYGKWTEAGEKLAAMVIQHPSNRGLRKWQDSIGQVLTILAKE